jgi:bifunctional non-homologous end joining protein LigD
LANRFVFDEVERDGDRVRLITRSGYNWTDRYPWIVEAARKVRQKHLALDGEAVALGVDGISDFNAPHSRKHDHEVQLCAFDIVAEGGDDLRNWHCTFVRAIWNGYLHDDRKASSSIHLNEVRSALISFARRARWV